MPTAARSKKKPRRWRRILLPAMSSSWTKLTPLEKDVITKFMLSPTEDIDPHDRRVIAGLLNSYIRTVLKVRRHRDNYK